MLSNIVLMNGHRKPGPWRRLRRLLHGGQLFEIGRARGLRSEKAAHTLSYRTLRLRLKILTLTTAPSVESCMHVGRIR